MLQNQCTKFVCIVGFAFYNKNILTVNLADFVGCIGMIFQMTKSL